MRRNILCLLLFWASIPPRPASAAPDADWHAVYDAYAAGFNAVQLRTSFGFDAQGYRLSVQSRTLGLVDLFVGSRQFTAAEGVWQGERPQPRQFRADGLWRGKRRTALIDYEQGMPVIRDLVPPETSREPVSPQLQADTLDTLSPLAFLAYRVAMTGNCDATARTFDGRRLEAVTARTGGWEMLPPSTVSVFTGRALRCEFEAHQIGGFASGEDRERAAQPRRGSIWVASPAPGAPPLPVQIRLEYGWLGHATAYLSEIGRGPFRNPTGN
jgi:hypothetical protein